jgi:predicted transcriptional regulator
VEKRNITLSLPSALVKRVKIVAAKRETSVSALLAASLEEIVRRDDGSRTAATRRVLTRAARGFDLGTGGQIHTSRDELHER